MERKLATVLFADLVGSTAMAGNADPERTRLLLDRFYDAMAAEIEAAGGTVEKFVGDAVMAAFGAPAAQEDHAERALHAALAMQRRLTTEFGERLALRIGVNTGDVVVDRPREGSSFVTGDAVNVCARLEQAAAAGEILVGERTVAAAEGAFEFAAPATVEAKGKPGGVVSRRLLRAVSLIRPRGVPGLGRAFVGREAEIEALQSAYAGVVESGSPHLVTILGDPGVGKTRLTQELWEWLGARAPEPARLTGRCLSYGQGITYWPLAEVLKEHYAILESDPADVVAARLAGRPFLGVTLGLSPSVELHPLAARERLHDAWVGFMQELAHDRPMVLLVEDLHWADDDLCDLLETLVADVQGPLLLIATARAEFLNRRPAWGRRGSTRIAIDALTSAGAEDLLTALLGARPPEAVRRVVVERAEGNPFFVEELVSTLIDRGALRYAGSAWSFGEMPDGFDVPDSVQAVLAARIDLLPAAEKAALQAAAVIGRVFWTGPVYDLLDGVQPDLAVLEERDFIRRRHGSSIAGEREYVIKHALTREVAYAGLPKAVRGHRHAAFARWLEVNSGERDEHAPLLAYHYAEAVTPEDVDLAWPGRDAEVAELRAKAVEWSRRAAAAAVSRYEMDDAVALLQRSLTYEFDPAAQGEIWHAIGHANALRFDGPGFLEAMERAMELEGPTAELATELALQGVRRSGMWIRRYDPALLDGWVERALELSPEGSPTYPWALAALALRTTDDDAVRKLGAAAGEMGDAELQSHALAAATALAWRRHEYERARIAVERRLELLARISLPDDRHFALMQAVEVNLALGRIAAAEAASGELLEMTEGLTPHHRLHGVTMHLRVQVLAERFGDVRALTSLATAAVEANATTPCPSNLTTLLYCALASLDGGDPDEARRLEALGSEIDTEGFEEFESPRLRLALMRNDLGELRRLVDGLRSVEFAPYGFDAGAVLLDALVALGDRDRIEAEAPRWMETGTYTRPFALRSLGLARRDSGMIEEAAVAFDGIGLEREAAQTRAIRT